MSTTNETETNEVMEKKVFGQVKWFNIKAGYGFITLIEGENAGKDIFVHYSSLNVINSQYKYLVQGEYVEFNLVKLDNDKYEYHAVDVKGIKGGPIMCETRRQAMETRPDFEHRSRVHRVRPRPREQRDDNQERRTVRKSNSREEPVQNQSNEEPGFEKVVKKRQSRAKNA